MIGVCVEGLMLGLAMGGYCATSCAPFLIPYLLASETYGLVPRLRLFGAFLAGRLAAYLAVAVLAAFVGRRFQDPMPVWMKGAFLITAAVVLIVFSAVSGWRRDWFCVGTRAVRIGGALSFATGLILGCNLCPPFVVAFFRAVEMASAAKATVYFSSLFLGTTVYLVPAPFVSWWVASEFARRLGIYLGILAGVWFLVQGLVLVL